LQRAAVCQMQSNFRPIVDGYDPGTGFQAHPRVLLASLQQHGQQVSTVDDAVGFVEALDEALPQGDAQDVGGVHGVAHYQRIGAPGESVDAIHEAQPAQGTHAVGRDLHAGADLFNRPLKNPLRASASAATI
jgi:hypothetical protein